MRGKTALLGAAGALLLTLGAGTAQADHPRECAKKINKAERNLDKAIRKHGWRSDNAQKRRAQLQRVRAQCGGFGWSRGRDDGRFRDRDWRDDDRRWNRGRRDNTWNRGRGNRGRSDWFWSRDGRRHRHSHNGAWCTQRH
jgi:hypothetical protein